MKKAVALVSLAVIAVLGIGLSLSWLERAPSGPVEPVWDFERCAHCGMHLAERPYAAQLHDDSGEVVFFDDPGCLLLWRAETGSTGTSYFHHAEEERWIAESDAVFVSAEQTPMGWGLAVVDRATAGARSSDERWSAGEALDLLEQNRPGSEASR